jgi:hypothetical protein
MANQRIEFKNPVGMLTDRNSADLPMESWSSALNVSFRDGQSRKALGYSKVFGTTPVDISFLIDNIENGQLYWYEGTPTKLYRTEGTSHVDLTKASGNYLGTAESSWNGTVLNTVVVMNNGIDKPQSIRKTDPKFIDLPNWPTTATCKVMRSYKNYLVALNVTKGGTEYPTLVKWSSPADPGEVPSTWNEADPTNDAGENPLSSAGDAILEGRKLRDSFIIYKERSVHSMNYIGGTFVFGFRQLFDDIGIMSTHCVAEFDGKHFVLGKGDVYVHNGVEKKSVISGKAKDLLFSNIRNDAYQRCFVVPDYNSNEMWVCYPSNNKYVEDKGCDRAFVWNWSEDTWSQRELPKIRYATFGIVDPKVSDAWDSATGSWNTDSVAWGEQNYNPSKTKILMTSQVNDKVYVVGDESSFDGEMYFSSLEKRDIHLGDDRGVKTITSVTPHVKGKGSLQIYVGYSNIQNTPVLWKGPFEYEIGAQYKIDCRVVGRYGAIMVEAVNDTEWSLNGFTIEYAPSGGLR